MKLTQTLILCVLIPACGCPDANDCPSSGPKYSQLTVGPDVSKLKEAVYAIESVTCDFMQVLSAEYGDIRVEYEQRGCYWSAYHSPPPTIDILPPWCETYDMWALPLTIHELLHAFGLPHDESDAFPHSVLRPTVQLSWRIEQHHIDHVNRRYCQ